MHHTTVSFKSTDDSQEMISLRRSKCLSLTQNVVDGAKAIPFFFSFYLCPVTQMFAFSKKKKKNKSRKS